MKPALKKSLIAFALALVFALGAAAYLYQNTVRIVVYHTNDIHGWIMPQKVKSEIGNSKSEMKLVGGFAVLANYLKEKPKGYLLIDSGDFFQGTPEGDLTKGDSVIECMNALGYTAAALGNHEYDLGEENIKRLSRFAKFPFLSANALTAKTKERVSYAKPYLIKEIDGAKVAVIGLNSSNMKNLVLPKNIAGLEFQREADALARAVEEVKREGAQVILVAAHVGIETPASPPDIEGEKFLARTVGGIHLILGGHTHFGLQEPFQDEKNKTLIVHNQSGLTTVTRTMLRVWKKSGKIFCYNYKLIPLDVEKIGEDPEVKKIVEHYQKKVGERLDVVIGESKMALVRKNPALPEEAPVTETLLGNWQTDVMRKFAKTELAFHNIGGIRADLPEGKLTLRHMYLLSPFGNTVVTMELTGAQIKEILEHSISGRQGVLQVSGLTMVFDKSKPEGERVVKVTLSGKPLEMKKYYKVATNSFVANGGDGYATFKFGRRKRDTFVTMLEIETEYVKKNSPISAKIEGRIIGQ